MLGRYIVKRILVLFPMIIVMSMLVFGLSALSAGDAARVLAERIYEHPTQTEIEEVRHEYGLDEPLIKQYGRWLSHAMRGDFGASYRTQKPALEEIKRHFPDTGKLAVTSLFLLLITGLLLGVISAVWENSWLDRIIQIFTFFSVSLPPFWIGLMLLYLFGVKLSLISVMNGSDGFLILPAITMDIGYFGVVIRLVRSSLSDVLKQDYIRACRAKGLSPFCVILKHGMKNAVLPVMTQMSSIIVSLFCGSAIIETIFSIRGIGNLALESVYTKDVPVLQCFILLVTCFVVVLNLTVDILYSVLDARIQLS